MYACTSVVSVHICRHVYRFYACFVVILVHCRSPARHSRESAVGLLDAKKTMDDFEIKCHHNNLGGSLCQKICDLA